MNDHGPPARPSCRDDFKVAIICTLRHEYDAVLSILDGFWNEDGDSYGKIERDKNTYTTGWIGQHNVVLVLVSDMGKANAASVATSLSLSFSKIKLAFLVGVCGVMPRTREGAEIVLGDVVISDRILEYDFGRRYSDGIKIRRGELEQSHDIRRYIATMQTEHYRKLLPKRAIKWLRVAQEKFPERYASLRPIDDRLFLSDYRHKHQESVGCEICGTCSAPSQPVCELALGSTCEELKCDESQLIRRRRLDGSDPLVVEPMVHWGVIASGDTNMKSALDRDRISNEHGIIAFEMEGAGACHIFPCIVVKGACDYADSHKSKKWQNYAALTAACVMKALVTWFPKTDQWNGVTNSTTSEDIISYDQEYRSTP
jgi:nucleoside phosphorylase